MNPKRTHRITTTVIAIVLAIVLLVSGWSKAADAAYFSDLIYKTFHLPWLALMAPGLILAEIALGVLLLTQYKRRLTAILIAAMLVVVTTVYILGICLYGMTSCGCFGHLRWLNLNPTGTIIRNIVMLGLCVYLMVVPTKTTKRAQTTLTTIVLLLAMTAGAWMTGYTMRGAMVLWARSQHWQGTCIEESPLKNLGLSADSTYLVFTFSFHCPYCQMAIGNVSLYESSGTVDRVVALAAEDSVGEAQFRNCYPVSPIPYSTLPMQEMIQIVPELPTTFLVTGDTIRHVWTGEVPAPMLIR